jgi:hypothetical protein
MSIGTQERTQPRLGLYYAIMVGAFAISITALLALNWAAFVVIAGVSTVAVIIAAMRLGVAGEQVVVEEPPRPPFSLRRLLVEARARWRVIAVWGVLMIAAFLWITVAQSMPVEWQDRVMLLAYSGLLVMYGLIGVGEIRSVFTDFSNTELDRKRLVLRAILVLSVIALAAVFLYDTLQREITPSWQLSALLAANPLLMFAKLLARTSQPTPPAPSQPAAE